MSKKNKHKPARPHWQREASKRANGVSVILQPEGVHSSFYGSVVILKERAQRTRKGA